MCFSDDVAVVRVGSSKYNGGQIYQVLEYFKHPFYNLSTSRADIGLIRVKEPIGLNQHVTAIELETSYVTDKVPCTAIGFGVTSTFLHPKTLQHIRLSTVSNAYCKFSLSDYSGKEVLDSNICTLTKIGEGTCYGDSGGPLVGENGRQIGVVSWGRPCAKGYPDVYTRTSSYAEWIRKIIEDPQPVVRHSKLID